MGQEAVVHLIESFGKVEDDDIGLNGIVKVFCDFICQLGELANARVSCSEPVLEWGQYLVTFKMVHHVTDHNVFHYFAWNTRQ